MFANETIKVEVESKTFEVLWQDLGSKQEVTVFRDGKKLGTKEFSHLTDQGEGVIQYAIKSILFETGLKD